jgi:hypothetical protein
MSTVVPSSDRIVAHWDNFIYRRIARHWHALWCRWSPAGELRTHFRAERKFEPTESGDGANMHVVYHYADARGTVSTGPPCGPWRICEAEHSRADGMQHPASPEMTTLLLPCGGPSAWCMKSAPSGVACATELFLHHGDHLRMSAGVVHAADGSLAQLALIREDARGQWWWPSSFGNGGGDGGGEDDGKAESRGDGEAPTDLPNPDRWSSSLEASVLATPAGVDEALRAAGAPTASRGAGFAISAGLVQRELHDWEWGATRVGKVASTDVAMLCADSRVAIVAPAKRAEGAGLCSATAWWPSEVREDGPSLTLYTIEASWAPDGALEEVRYLTFRR